MKLPEALVVGTHDQLGEALSRPIDLIVLGVSSPGVEWAIQHPGPLLTSPTPILMLTKGLRARHDTRQILPLAVQDGLAANRKANVLVGATAGRFTLSFAALSLLLTDYVARPAGGSSINRDGTVFVVLRHVRRGAAGC